MAVYILFFLIAHMFNFCMRLYFPPRFCKVSEKKYEKKKISHT